MILLSLEATDSLVIMVADFKQKQKKARVFRLAFAFGGVAIVGVALLLVSADISIYNKKKAVEIIKRIEAYFEWVKRQ